MIAAPPNSSHALDQEASVDRVPNHAGATGGIFIELFSLNVSPERWRLPAWRDPGAGRGMPSRFIANGVLEVRGFKQVQAPALAGGSFERGKLQKCWRSGRFCRISERCAWHIQGQCRCTTEEKTLIGAWAKVERRIKNTHLKPVDAPVRVKPSLKCWMELNG